MYRHAVLADEGSLCTLYRMILSMNLECPWHETDDSPPSSAEVNQMPSWHGISLLQAALCLCLCSEGKVVVLYQHLVV